MTPFHIHETSEKEFYFTVKLGNSKMELRSENYKRKKNAVDAIKSLRKLISETELQDVKDLITFN